MNKTNYPENLVGMTVIPTKECDTCPNEQENCKKLSLSDGAYICLKAKKSDVEAIDLGLPSGRKWANMNLGAKAPEDPGLYYNWGATEGHADGSDDDFYWSTYDDTPAAKIKTDLPLEHDAAHALLGGDWHMPTKEDFKELCDNCTSEWTTRNGMKGRLFTSKTNGNSIFFPAAGSYNGASLRNRGAFGYYWSASRIRFVQRILLVLL
ncbi:MAG: hypothetical protein IJ155_04350 [Prevotella sp.]|nr:hypothetical protein [Prevotella sp.]